MEENLKISIITVCLNSEKYIERTIQSVVEQTYSNIEYIIIDGISTDNTQNIINKYRDKIDVFISEADNGIYDAMNKGIQYATGDYIFFLNSGDRLYNHKICEKLIEMIRKISDPTIIYGDVVLYDTKNEKYLSQCHLTNVKFLTNGIYHQSIFASRDIFKKCGLFDTKYSIYADFEWLCRATFRYYEKKFYIAVPIAYYLMGGQSEQQWKKTIYEKYEIIHKYGCTSEKAKCIMYHPIFGIGYLVYIAKSQYKNLAR